MPQHLFCDQKDALEFRDRCRGSLEEVDLIDAVSVSLDFVGKTTATPRNVLQDVPPASLMERTVRSKIALLRSSATSGRKIIMSS